MPSPCFLTGRPLILAKLPFHILCFTHASVNYMIQNRMIPGFWGCELTFWCLRLSWLWWFMYVFTGVCFWLFLFCFCRWFIGFIFLSWPLCTAWIKSFPAWFPVTSLLPVVTLAFNDAIHDHSWSDAGGRCPTVEKLPKSHGVNTVNTYIPTMSLCSWSLILITIFGCNIFSAKVSSLFLPLFPHPDNDGLAAERRSAAQ